MEIITREQWLTKSVDILFDVILTDDVIAPYSAPPVRVSVAPMTSKKLGVCHVRRISDDCASGHRNYFAKVARAAGLEGKFTATTAGPQLREVLESAVKILGPIPHAKLNLKPKEKGRNNNKIVCGSCGFQANLSRKWADRIALDAECPVCARATINLIRS